VQRVVDLVLVLFEGCLALVDEVVESHGSPSGRGVVGG
jgi:hypothetical protein